jgi:hypothetical protein
LNERAKTVTTDDNRRPRDRESNAALLAGLLAAVLVILLTAMALLAFPGAAGDSSAISSALA